MRVANALAEILKREGVECLIGYPVNPLIEAAAAADIRTIIVRQERTGVHMADALSRLSSGDRVGVFAMQHGPGTENTFGAIAQAYSEGVPLVVVPAGYQRAWAQVKPNFQAFLNFQHVSKSVETITLAGMTTDVLRRAFTQAKNGRMGPALVELPTDVAGEELSEPLDYEPGPRLRSAPDPRIARRGVESSQRLGRCHFAADTAPVSRETA
jgi:thiamine pyrophosphate-dependent acetolactate synthase large subunit-like protein